MAKVPVTDIKAVELARQITILVSKLYADIPYLELLNKDKPTCSRMIQVSNKVRHAFRRLFSFFVALIDRLKLTRFVTPPFSTLDYRVVD